jgi:hypothetical protein
MYNKFVIKRTEPLKLLHFLTRLQSCENDCYIRIFSPYTTTLLLIDDFLEIVYWGFAKHPEKINFF